MATILEHGSFEIVTGPAGRPIVKALGFRIKAAEGEDVGRFLLTQARTAILAGIKVHTVDTSGSTIEP